jgi:hypothetical protein
MANPFNGRLHKERNNMTQRQKYNPSRGGHAPGHLRDALLATLSEHCDDVQEGTWWRHLAITFFNLRQQIQWETLTPRERAIWLTGQLWNCRDILPGSVCALAGLSQGSTYAQLVRQLRGEINASSDCSVVDSETTADTPAQTVK